MRAARLAGIGVLSVAVLVAATLAYVSSAAGGNWLLHFGQGQLEKRYGVHIDYAEAEFSLWHGLKFRNLHLVINQDRLRADVVIPALSFLYKLDLWSRRVTVEELSADHPVLQLEITPAPSEPAEPSGASLPRLPVEVVIKKVAIVKLSADVKQSGAILHARDLDLLLDLAIQPDLIHSAFEFDLGRGGEVVRGPMRANFAGRGHGEVSVKQQPPGPLEIDLAPSHAELEFTNISVTPTLSLARAELKIDGARAAELKASFAARLHKLMIPGKLARPADAGFNGEFHAPANLAEFHFNGDLSLAAQKLMTLKLDGQNFAPKPLHVDAHMNWQTDPALNRLVKIAFLQKNPRLKADLGVVADMDSEQNVQAAAELNVPAIRMGAKAPLRFGAKTNAKWQAKTKTFALEPSFDLESADVGRWQAHGKTNGAIEGMQKFDGDWDLTQLRSVHDLVLNEKLKLHHELSHEVNGRLRAEVSLKVPRVSLKNTATLSTLDANCKLDSRDGAGKDLDFDLAVKQGPIEVKNYPRLEGLNVAVNGTLRGGDVLLVPKIHLDLNRSFVRVDGEASGRLSRGDFQIKTTTDLAVPTDVPALRGHMVRGQMHAPFNLTVFRGHEVALEGGVDFKNFSWQAGDLALQNLNGTVPWREKLSWDGTNVRFSELIKENPFERVDFNRVRPLLHGNQQLRIDKLRWHDREYGPFVGFLGLKQNMISIHQFDLDLLAGKTYGEMFFNFQPGNWQLGFLGRLTGLNLTEFLPEQFLRRLDRRTRDLSARAGLVLNLNRATLEGRVDVTEIGGRQLVALINVLDPEYRDEKMNKLRSLLQVGYPSMVSAGMSEGFMDLDVDIALLGVATRQKIHAIPLSGLIGKYTRGLVETAAKGILK